jgi:hypothetical protein
LAVLTRTRNGSVTHDDYIPDFIACGDAAPTQPTPAIFACTYAHSPGRTALVEHAA